MWNWDIVVKTGNEAELSLPFILYVLRVSVNVFTRFPFLVEGEPIRYASFLLFYAFVVVFYGQPY